MNLKLTRRQFGQLAAVSTAATAVGVLASRSFAQTPSVILGIRPGLITRSNSSLAPEIDSTDDTDETTSVTASTSRSIIVQSLVLGSLEVSTTLTTLPILESAEQLSGFAALRNGTLVVAATNFATNRREPQPTRLIILGVPLRILTVSGLRRQETLVNLLTLQDGSLGGLVAKRNGTPPVTIVRINTLTGAITEEDKLRGTQRVTTVANCQDGSLYGIEVGRRGETSLELIDRGRDQSTPLRFNNRPWNSGFSSLVCSASNQLFALGARRYESPKYLHTINQSTGVITRIKDFDVAKIAVVLG